MANRSDILSHLPRSVRKTIKLGVAKGFIEPGQQEADVRALFVKAHRSYKNFKFNRKDKVSDPTQKATPESESGEA